ncbi:unnamed protein product [Urochloa humidicola]
MVGSAPLGDGRPAWSTISDGPSRTKPSSRVAEVPLPCAISGDGRHPRPTTPTSASKKRRSTFVAPTRPTGPRPGGVVPWQDLNAGVDPFGIRPRQFPDAALAPGVFLPCQLFQAPPTGPNAGRKAQTPSFSEPAQLLSHQVQKTSMEAIASDTRRTASTTSMQDDGDYFSSSSMPF